MTTPHEAREDRLAAAFDGDFMQPEILFGDWVAIEHCIGETVYPRGDEPTPAPNEHVEMLLDKFGARLSAPGHLDCTDWALFETEEEAAEYLIETYGDEF